MNRDIYNLHAQQNYANLVSGFSGMSSNQQAATLGGGFLQGLGRHARQPMPTTTEIMQIEVDEWLGDWDK